MATHNATITINASASKVFETLTNPELVKRWQFEKTVTTDWKPGSVITFSAYFGDKILKQWGTVLDLRVNELVKYNLFTPQPGLEDKTENYFTTSYTLTHSGEKTIVELIQEENRTSGFTPVNLMPILAVLKEVAESLE